MSTNAALRKVPSHRECMWEWSIRNSMKWHLICVYLVQFFVYNKAEKSGMLRLGERIMHVSSLLLSLWRRKEYRGRNKSKHDEVNQNKRNKKNKPVSNIIVHHDLGAEELPGRPKTQVVHVEAGCEIFLDYVATIPFWEQEVESTVQKEIPWPTHRACSGDHPGSVAHADVRLRRGGAVVKLRKRHIHTDLDSNPGPSGSKTIHMTTDLYRLY